MAGLPDEDIPTMSSAELKGVVAAEMPAPTTASARPGEGSAQGGVPVTLESLADDEPPTGNKAAPGAKPAEPAEEEDIVTATTPRAEAPKSPLSAPGRVEIRTAEREDKVGTDAETLAGAAAAFRAGALAAAKEASVAAKVDQAPLPKEDEDDGATMTAQAPAPAGPAVAAVPSPIGDDTKDDDEDGATVTTQAPAPRVGSVPDPAPDVIRISPKSLVGQQPKTLLGDPPEPSTLTGDNPTVPGPTGAKTADVTSPKAASAVDAYAEDSVTALAPLSPASVDVARAKVAKILGRQPSAPASDDTDATTQRKSYPPASPADGEVESITTEAPGHLTKMLRVIASEHPALDDELPESTTAVMPNAPVKGLGIQKHGTLQGMGPVSPIGRMPPTAPTGAAALRLEPNSESGLRVARDVTSDEHASIDAILGAQAHERVSGRGGIDSDARLAHAPTEAMYPLGITTGDIPPPRAPRYGLLVTVVAAISIAVPVSLYMVLYQEPLPPQTPAQASGDMVKRGDPLRPKATKGAPSSSASSGSKKPQHR